jgi:hypothetical protein
MRRGSLAHFLWKQTGPLPASAWKVRALRGCFRMGIRLERLAATPTEALRYRRSSEAGTVGEA